MRAQAALGTSWGCWWTSRDVLGQAMMECNLDIDLTIESDISTLPDLTCIVRRC
jgi:hypothetical protein